MLDPTIDCGSGAIGGAVPGLGLGAIPEQAVSGTWLVNPAILSKGWASAGIWYNTVAQLNGAVTSAVLNIPLPSKYPEVMEYTGGVTRMSYDEAYRIHKKNCDEFRQTNKRIYSIALKRTNEYIGYCGFQYCEILNGEEILYGYSKEYWGNGYANEAAKSVIKYGIDELGISEIVAAVNPGNLASEKTLLRIGMKYIREVEWPKQGLVKKYRITSICE